MLVSNKLGFFLEYCYCKSCLHLNVLLYAMHNNESSSPKKITYRKRLKVNISSTFHYKQGHDSSNHAKKLLFSFSLVTLKRC